MVVEYVKKESEGVVWPLVRGVSYVEFGVVEMDQVGVKIEDVVDRGVLSCVMLWYERFGMGIVKEGLFCLTRVGRLDEGQAFISSMLSLADDDESILGEKEKDQIFVDRRICNFFGS